MEKMWKKEWYNANILAFAWPNKRNQRVLELENWWSGYPQTSVDPQVISSWSTTIFNNKFEQHKTYDSFERQMVI